MKHSKFLKIITVFALAAMMTLCAACASNKGFINKLNDSANTSAATSAETSLKLSVLENDALSEGNIHLIGRTEKSDKDGCLYTYFTATGFTARFYGTELKVTYTATNTSSNTNRPYFTAFVDGETGDGTSFSLSSATQEVKVATKLKEGMHTVTVLKRSEPENSLTAIKSIKTDGEFYPPATENKLKFQIVGASGISGHGALGSDGDGWTTENSSSLKGFGYLAAEKFGAECQFVTASATGMVWTYRGVAPLPDFYDYAGLVAAYNGNGSTKSVTPVTTGWDHSSWVPDVIIANVGGNDWNARISSLSSGSDERREAETTFKNAVKSFLEHVHELYPNAKVVWTCNSRSSGNGKLAADAINTLSFKNLIFVTEIDNSKGGADNHASLAVQQKNAKTVADAITANCGYVQKG
ncbi:MAG: hypothetical protein J5762_02520 [Clostridia bacterium]|nr:hypothetical protein [Clostridia bacterium]